MIKIENLTKIYRAKNKTDCVALSDVNLILPEKGFVFVLGKSGSGKSTLLNLIGGLDSFEKGNVISYGNSLKDFSTSDYEAYRSDFVSFIFQDYHLIDELTVMENILLFNEDNVDEEFLQKVLTTAELQDCVNKYPSELSGGQKQRVAIARGIVKNPKVILCDEPTGNLDRKTSLQILDLLKTLSHEKLVLIVSHNLSEAQTYADRIIQLADGKIIDDVTKKENYEDRLYIENGKAVLPYHGTMTETELQSLNKTITDGQLKEVTVNESGFLPSKMEYIETKKPLTARKFGRKNTLKLFKKFLLAKKWSAVATIILSIVMFAIFTAVQAFTAFDTNAALKQSLTDPSSVLVLEQDYSGFPNNIYDDLTPLQNEKTYPLYSQTIWLNNSLNSSWDYVNRFSDAKNFSDLYIHENYGLLLCDEEYLLDLYGKNGKIPLLAGTLNNERGSGILITDYFADSIIYHEILFNRLQYVNYNSILGIFKPVSLNSAADICGIIDTDYTEKYQDLVQITVEYLTETKNPNTAELQKILSNNPQYVEFVDDVKTHLGVGYCLNPNYIDAFSLQETSLVKVKDFYFSANEREVYGANLNFMSTYISPLSVNDFADGEIGLPYALYNSLFDANKTSADAKKLHLDEQKTVTVKKYINNGLGKTVLFEKEFLVTHVTDSRLCCNENTMLYFKRAEWQPSRIYVKDVQDMSTVTAFMEKGDYHFVSTIQQSYCKINEVVSAMHNLFLLIEITLFVMIFLYLALFGMRSIRQNSYQIGVIKAFGGSTREIGTIFVFKTFLIGFITVLLSSLVSVPFIMLANSALITSMETLLKISLQGFVIIRVMPSFLLADAAILLLITSLSSLAPTVLLKRIKPIDILKAKE